MATAIRRTTGAARDPAAQDAVDRIAGAARSALGQARYDAATTAVAQFSPAELIDSLTTSDG
jgi:hypothetical protein